MIYCVEDDHRSTLLERSLYCAQRLPDGTVLRLATTQHSVLTLILGFAQDTSCDFSKVAAASKPALCGLI